MKLYVTTLINSEAGLQSYGLHVALGNLPAETQTIKVMESRTQKEIWAFDEMNRPVAVIREVK